MKINESNPTKEKLMDTVYTIKEAGKNGTITLTLKGIQRNIKRSLRKDDMQFIPWANVERMFLNERSLGSDAVMVSTLSGTNFTWKSPGAKAIFQTYMEL